MLKPITLSESYYALLEDYFLDNFVEKHKRYSCERLAQHEPLMMAAIQNSYVVLSCDTENFDNFTI